MSRFFRALLVCTTATGAAALLLALLSSGEEPLRPSEPPREDPDELSPEAQALLLRELADQL